MLVAQLLFRQLFAVVWNRRAVGRGGEDKDLAHPKFGDFQMFSSKMEVSMNFIQTFRFDCHDLSFWREFLAFADQALQLMVNLRQTVEFMA